MDGKCEINSKFLTFCWKCPCPALTLSLVHLMLLVFLWLAALPVLPVSSSRLTPYISHFNIIIMMISRKLNAKISKKEETWCRRLEAIEYRIEPNRLIGINGHIKFFSSMCINICMFEWFSITFSYRWKIYNIRFSKNENRHRQNV